MEINNEENISQLLKLIGEINKNNPQEDINAYTEVLDELEKEPDSLSKGMTVVGVETTKKVLEFCVELETFVKEKLGVKQ